MKRLILCCAFLMALNIVSAADAMSQIVLKPIPVGGLTKIVVTDSDFGTQTLKPILSVKPQIGYEVWITTDGILHCKTNSTLKTASIQFTPPIMTSAPDANGTTTGSFGGYGRKFEPNKPAGSDAYLFNISSDKYKAKHSITLSISSTNGAKADITLVNKKVPEKVQN